MVDKRSYLSLLAGLGLSAGVFSTVFVLALVAKLLVQGRLNLVYLLGFAGAAWGFLYVARYALRVALKLGGDEVTRPAPAANPPSLQNQIMLLARAAEGRLSASEVAAATQLTLEGSHDELERLVKVGLAELWVTDEGGLVYVFPEFFEGFKDSAKSPLSSRL